MVNLLKAAGIEPRTRGISKRFQNDIQMSIIKQMPYLARQMEDVVSLAWGIPSFTTPEHIRKETAQKLMTQDNLSFYSPSLGLPELQDAVGARFEKDYGVKIDARNEIAITSGAMPALMAAWAAIVDPGDEVLITSPAFPSYTDQVKMFGGIPVYVPLDEADNFRLKAEEVEKRITNKTKAIIICNPNNPTGTVQKEADLRKIGELALKHDFWVINDDPYNYCTFDDHKYFSLASVPELKDNSVTIRTFSKEYAMTGWRVGMIYAEAGFIRETLKFTDNAIVSTARLCQIGAIEALTGPQDSVTLHIAELKKRRDLMYERVKALPTLFETQLPEGSYYMFPKIVPQIDDIDLALDILYKAKVQVVPGSGFGPTAAGHIRLCFGYTPEDINKAFDRIEDWWRKQ